MTTPTLTGRERRVLHAIAVGATYAEIGQALDVSHSTAKLAAIALYAKLHARNAAHAIHRAYVLGLLRACAVCGTPTGGAAECDPCAIREETLAKRREDV